MARMTVMMIVTAAMFATGMIVVMAVAVGAGILRENAGEQLGNCLVRRAGDAGIELDIGVIQRDLRAHADAAANQRIHALRGEETGERAMTAALRRDDGADHLAVLHFIDLELLGVAEVLENLTIFVSDCNLHKTIPPVLLVSCCAWAGGTARALLRRVAKDIIPAIDDKLRFRKEKAGKLDARGGIDRLHGGAGDVHPAGAFFLRERLVVDQTKAFVFIHRHVNNGERRTLRIAWDEPGASGQGAHAPALAWAGHASASFRKRPVG